MNVDSTSAFLTVHAVVSSYHNISGHVSILFSRLVSMSFRCWTLAVSCSLLGTVYCARPVSGRAAEPPAAKTGPGTAPAQRPPTRTGKADRRTPSDEDDQRLQPDQKQPCEDGQPANHTSSRTERNVCARSCFPLRTRSQGRAFFARRAAGGARAKRLYPCATQFI
jgi:hypothetical protein